MLTTCKLFFLEYYASVTFVVHTREQLYTAERKKINRRKTYTRTHNTCAQQKCFFSMALAAHSGPWPHIQFRNHFFTGGRIHWTSDELIARPLPKHRTTQTQNKRIHTRNIRALSGIRTHDPSVRASEGSSCLRPRGYCDRLAAKTVHALDGAATVTGAQQK
jgi:hypothetical protein